MFKKTLIAAAALSTLVLGASAANAGYAYGGYGHGYGYGYGHGYGYGYGYHHTEYQPSCYSESRPVTIRVWDDYSCEYVFRTIFRSYQICE
jgi:hypothetical protein